MNLLASKDGTYSFVFFPMNKPCTALYNEPLPPDLNPGPRAQKGSMPLIQTTGNSLKKFGNRKKRDDQNGYNQLCMIYKPSAMYRVNATHHWPFMHNRVNSLRLFPDPKMTNSVSGTFYILHIYTIF